VLASTFVANLIFFLVAIAAIGLVVLPIALAARHRATPEEDARGPS
jgi:hypothetical protein